MRVNNIVLFAAGLLRVSLAPGFLSFASATTHARAHEGEINWGATYNTPENAYFLWLETATTNPFLVVTSTATADIAETVIDNDHHAVQDNARELLHEAEDGDGCVKNVTSLLTAHDTTPATGAVPASELTFAPNSTCAYRLLASGASTTLPMKLFKLDLTGANHILLFSNSSSIFTHLQLLDEEGHVIKAAHKLHEAHAAPAAAAHDDHDHKPWGEVLLACLTVNLIAFTGVLVVAATMVCKKGEENMTDFAKAHAEKTRQASWIAGSSAFAAGALLAAAAYFMWFEATHLITDGMTDAEESTIVFLWGTAILFGFLVPPAISVLFQFILPQKDEGDSVVGTPTNKVATAGELEGVADGAVAAKKTDVVIEENIKDEPLLKKLSSTLLVSVLLGDFFHNFADGVFIGAAFLTCSHSRGWIVALGAVLHEIAQEIADYLMLTGPGKLTPVQALGLNFTSGLSVMLGGLLALASDYDELTVGLIVAFGGGTYAYLACVECMGRAMPPAGSVDSGKKQHVSAKQQLAGLGLFVLGAVCIGLALFEHEHCGAHDHGAEAGAAGGAHAGHGH
ncbi:unnamed protein product [Amoebophrya sp. A120]|nr:unnamed protein product [Amoebophrya sp. A120]|eukprot:GSA120T00024185001.1